MALFVGCGSFIGPVTICPLCTVFDIHGSTRALADSEVMPWTDYAWHPGLDGWKRPHEIEGVVAPKGAATSPKKLPIQGAAIRRITQW